MKALQAIYTKSVRLEEALCVDSILKVSSLKQEACGKWAWGDSNRILTRRENGSANLAEEENGMDRH